MGGGTAIAQSLLEILPLREGTECEGGRESSELRSFVSRITRPRELRRSREWCFGRAGYFSVVFQCFPGSFDSGRVIKYTNNKPRNSGGFGIFFYLRK